MKRVLFFIALVLFVTPNLAQNLFEEPIPVIIPVKGNYKDAKIELKTNCISEPIKVKLGIQYEFTEPLNYTTHSKGKRFIQLKSAELIRIFYYKGSGFKDGVMLSRLKKIETAEEQCIWNLCVDAVNYWAKHQPYKKLDYDRYYRKYLYGNDPLTKIGLYRLIYLLPNN